MRSCFFSVGVSGGMAVGWGLVGMCVNIWMIADTLYNIPPSKRLSSS